MTTRRIPSLLCALLLAGTAGAEEAKDSKNPDQGEVIIATVNGTPYSLDLFRLFYLERLQQNQGENSPALQEQAFNEFMSLVVASQEAKRRDLEKDPDVAIATELQRMKILSNAALATMAEEITLTEDELKKAYEDIKKSTDRTEYKARHILVKEEAEAKAMIEKLEGGADFGDLAREHSLGPTGKNGGELDWFDANQMVAPFSEAVAAMDVGTYTKTPVQTQFGWHVIELQDKRQAQPPSFEDSKGQIEALLKRRKLGEKLIGMRDGAMVELNEEVVKFSPKEEAPAAESSKDQ